MKKYVCGGDRSLDEYQRHDRRVIVEALDKLDADRIYKQVYVDRWHCIIPYEASEEDIKRYPAIDFMTVSKVSDIIKRFNAYRIDSNVPPINECPDPKEIGIALERAIELMDNIVNAYGVIHVVKN